MARPSARASAGSTSVTASYAGDTLAGASAGLIKVVLNRQAVNYWVRSTGDLPPGVKHPKA